MQEIIGLIIVIALGISILGYFILPFKIHRIVEVLEEISVELGSIRKTLEDIKSKNV